MDLSKVKCYNCLNYCEEAQCFKKHVININIHPNEYREKHFCSIKCVKNYIEVNTKPANKILQVPIYNWNGGVS